MAQQTIGLSPKCPWIISTRDPIPTSRAAPLPQVGSVLPFPSGLQAILIHSALWSSKCGSSTRRDLSLWQSGIRRCWKKVGRSPEGLLVVVSTLLQGNENVAWPPSPQHSPSAKGPLSVGRRGDLPCAVYGKSNTHHRVLFSGEFK